MKKALLSLFLPMLSIASAADGIQIIPEINDKVTIEIPYGESYTFVSTSSLPMKGGDGIIEEGESRFFHGTSEDSISTLNMVKYPGEDDKYVGSIVDGNKNTIVQFSPGLDGEIEFVEFEAGGISPEIGLSEVPVEQLDSESKALAVPDDILGDDGSVLDIMVLWTKKSECSQSNLPKGCTLTSTTETNMRNLIDLAIFETNVAYANSGIETELRLVHAYRHPDFDEDDDSYLNAIYQLQRTNDGILDDVHGLRETHNADLVAMLIDRSTYCGIAFVGPSKSWMFSITSYFCATGTYTFGHEVGHNLGLLHDRASHNHCDSNTANYNYGWRDPEARFRTVMAYNCASGQCDSNPGGGCTRIQHFSSSTVTYDGLPTGNSANDGARLINEVKATVAAYYQSGPPSTPLPTTSPTTSPPTSPTPPPTPSPTTSPTSNPTESPTEPVPFRLVSSETCIAHGLLPIVSIEDCSTAAADLDFTITWGPYGGYRDVVDGCSVRTSSQLFFNQQGVCDPDYKIDWWTYTGCQCADWMPCICRVPDSPLPTSSPTRSPTKSPTSSPTPSPTPSPTSPPSPAPNPTPTRPPITGPPISEPTSSPNTFPPNYDEWLIYGANAVVDSLFINVSQNINSGPKAAEVTIYESDCETEINSVEIVSLDSGPLVTPSHNITYRLFMDQSKLDDSDLVTFENDSKGTISFCTKLTTKTEDLSLAVSSKKLKFNVRFDLADASFTLGDISLGEDQVENVDLALEFTISAYECDESYERVENVYVLGPTAPEFRVCISPNSDDLRVTNMMLEMTGSNGFVYEPVDYGGSDGPITNEITDIEESGSTTMVITRLVTGLFEGEDSTLSVSGSCVLSSQDNAAGARKNNDLLPFTLTVLLQGAEEEPKEVGCLESLLARFL